MKALIVTNGTAGLAGAVPLSGAIDSGEPDYEARAWLAGGA